MNEGWLGEEYIVLFEEKAPELELAYGLSDFFRATNFLACVVGKILLLRIAAEVFLLFLQSP